MLPGCDTDHSPLSSTEVKNNGTTHLLFLHALMVKKGTTLLLCGVYGCKLETVYPSKLLPLAFVCCYLITLIQVYRQEELNVTNRGS